MFLFTPTPGLLGLGAFRTHRPGPRPTGGRGGHRPSWGDAGDRPPGSASAPPSPALRARRSCFPRLRTRSVWFRPALGALGPWRGHLTALCLSFLPGKGEGVGLCHIGYRGHPLCWGVARSQPTGGIPLIIPHTFSEKTLQARGPAPRAQSMVTRLPAA